LRTEIGKLPGADEWRAQLRAVLPLQGAGVALQDLAGADDAQLCVQLTQRALLLRDSAMRLSDAVGQRYFAHADGADGVQRV
jgi:hypothetical protein